MFLRLNASAERHPMRGVGFYAIALFLFACLDTTTKYLVRHYPVPLLAFVRYLVHFLLMTAVLAPMLGRRLVEVHSARRVVLRGMCLVAMTLFMNFALARLPLAEGTSIMFVAPLLVVLMARPLLKEKIGLVRWLAVLAGFAGVLMIARPGGALDPVGVALVLAAALSNTFYQLLSRILSKTENAFAMLFYSALAGTICFGALMPWFFGGPRPGLLELALLLSLGVTGGIGHMFFTLAFRDAPASLLAPVTYLQLVWAGLLGWLVFAQLPDALTLLGMAIIAVSGVVVALHGRASG